ncbi:hypothetical protein BZG36_01111 [Bifiguratus adelaidae]|uniref:Pyridoxal phosphate homeostasis protein n=1 Tax=Bifiguratus adelaidae TaxID=1938954 RepID=A0A261Y608_9FUNG|nr:hypothetical protein BZG36_01111 [Bifiguratus adelaidae]
MSEPITVDPARKAELGENLAQVKCKVEAAATASSVTLVAVSKLKPAADILAAYEVGQRHFGENYVQEMVDKAAQLPKDIQWHFIGNLQSNKCKAIAAIPNLYIVETVDSIKKADTLSKACESRTESLKVFVQVNTSGEESKSGVTPQEAATVCQHILDHCPKLQLEGLMTIGAPDRELSPDGNPDFKLLAQLAHDFQQANPQAPKLGLSMGMSDDYEEALRMGSTNVRVGRTIFGERPKKT